MTIKQLIRPTGTETTFRFWCGALFQLLLAVGVSAASAQVANDNIENRRVLKLEEVVTSSTTGCTVQRGCVDERLTGKCIEYHNDQWFQFTPATTGRYFVNVGGQKCRDVRGVQLVVLTGQPCQPATYRILSCTSLGTQDDVFVTPDSFRTAARHGMFTRDEVDAWFLHRDNHNTTAHEYGRNFAEKIVVSLPQFIRNADAVLATLRKHA